MVVKNANFITSASKLAEVPALEMVEFVILGRSNVGKSSTINLLANRKNLAKSSNTPGKTRLINYFEITLKNSENIEKSFRLVDLPGVGYAKVSKSQKKEWEKALLEFITKRKISLFLYLIDARHPNLEIDQQVIQFIQQGNRPLLLIFTKIDKLKKSELNRLQSQYPNAIFISNLKKVGVETLHQELFRMS